MSNPYLASIIATFILLIGCDNPFTKDYQLFVYPNRNDLTNHIEVGHFDSLDDARDQAGYYMSKYPNGDYEIGINCKKGKYGDLWVCKETIR
jgi:hypothetical protein